MCHGLLPRLSVDAHIARSGWSRSRHLCTATAVAKLKVAFGTDGQHRRAGGDPPRMRAVDPRPSRREVQSASRCCAPSFLPPPLRPRSRRRWRRRRRMTSRCADQPIRRPRPRHRRRGKRHRVEPAWWSRVGEPDRSARSGFDILGYPQVRRPKPWRGGPRRPIERAWRSLGWWQSCDRERGLTPRLAGYMASMNHSPSASDPVAISSAAHRGPLSSWVVDRVLGGHGPA